MNKKKYTYQKKSRNSIKPLSKSYTHRQNNEEKKERTVRLSLFTQLLDSDGKHRRLR